MNRDEDRIHCAIIQHLMLRGHPALLYHHPANEGSRSPRTGARLKKLGMVPGVPDIVLTLPNGRAAYMEVKSSKGRLTAEQKVWRERCERLGVPYAVVNDIDSAVAILTEWGAFGRRAA